MMTRSFCQEPDYPPPGFEKQVELVQSRIVSLSMNEYWQVQVKKMPQPQKFYEISLKWLRRGGCKLFCAIISP